MKAVIPLGVRHTRSAKSALLAFVVAASSSCATIVKGSEELVVFESTPPGAEVTIRSRGDSYVLHTGTTPCSFDLERGDGWFTKAKYDVLVEKEGYKPVDLRLQGKPNGWYMFGNIVFGGLIGWLAVDPATGAMYTISKDPVHVNLEKAGAPSP